jgi:polyisoprenoid-binding protein YceI
MNPSRRGLGDRLGVPCQTALHLTWGLLSTFWHTLLLACCTLLLPLANAFAQKPAIAITLDSAAVNIHWTLNTTLHTVHGTFRLKSGAFSVNPATGNATGLIVVDAATGESGDSARDKRMHSAVLESAKYPAITFRPTHVDGSIDVSAPGPVTVSGVLSLHGQEHPLQITVILRPQPGCLALTTHFIVPFVAWGLKDPSTFIFRTDKEVALEIGAVITPEPAGAR